MPLTAQAVLDAARDRHSAFSRTQTPDATALRLLDALSRDLWAKAAQRNPDRVAVRSSIALPLADFAAGAALPEHAAVAGGSIISALGGVTVLPIIDPSIADRANFLAAYVEGTTLRLTGDAARWASYNVASLTLRLVPALAPLQTLAQALAPLPDDALEALTSGLALRFAMRGGDRSIDAAGFAAMATQAEAAWLDSLGARRLGQLFQVTEG